MSASTKWEDGKSNGYAWTSYSFWGSGSVPNVKVKKYCPTGMNDYWYSGGSPDNLTTLQNADDAAYQIDTDWRMPTTEELAALVTTKTNTTAYTWRWCDGSGTKQYRGSNVQGLEIKNNTTGVSLFLPAANTRTDITFNGVGTNGFYWSSTLNTSSPFSAQYLKITSTLSAEVRSDGLRCNGNSICPVRD